MSDYEELKGEVTELVKALEAASTAQLTETEQRLRAHLEKAVARIGELEAKVARMGEIEGKVARIAEIDAKIIKIADLEAKFEKIAVLEQKMTYLTAAMRHLRLVLEPLLQNWDTFFGSAPPALAVSLGSFRSALTILLADIGHLVP